MKTYYIYHIPGVKIGCTSQLKKRMKDQYFNSWEILEEHTEIYEASNREIELQKQYGYPVDKVLYWKSVMNRNLITFKTRSDAGKIGGSISGRINVESGHLKNIAGIGGKVSSNKIKTCPYCNKTCKGVGYDRWHGDNCKHKNE